MTIRLINPTKVHIRKVKGFDEGKDSYLLESEIDIVDANTIGQMMAILAKATPFDDANDFYPSKFGTPSYALTFLDEGEEKGLNVEGDLIWYDSGEDECGLLPEGKLLMVNLLDPLFGGVKTTQTKIIDIYLEAVGKTLKS